MEFYEPQVGDRVTVTAGTFETYSGVVSEIRGFKVAVSLVIFGRIVDPIEFSAKDLRRADRGEPPHP